jgi:outer membrane protein TolC
MTMVALALMAAGAAQAAQETSPLRLSLADAVARALSEGTAARLAGLSVQVAQNRASQALAATRPQAGGELRVASDMINLKTFGFATPGGPGVIGPFDVIDAHVNVAWEVINLAAKRRYEAATAGVRITEEERRRTENEVAAAVATLYVAVERSSARIDAIQANVDLFEKLRQLAVDRQKAGTGTRIDTTRADVQLARQRQAQLVAENQRDVALLALLRAVGADLGAQVSLTDNLTSTAAPAGPALPPLPPIDAALAMAREARPEMRTLKEQLRAAELAERAAKAQKLPRLTLSGQASEGGNHLRDLSWTRSLNAVASVPLFTGRRVEEQVAEAQIQQQEITLRQRDLERQVEQEVRQALLVAENARSRVALAEQGVRLAEDELEVARDRFQNGVASSIEVDNAQTSLATARDTRIDALADAAQARFDLARATGEIRTLIPEGDRP